LQVAAAVVVATGLLTGKEKTKFLSLRLECLIFQKT
jgi:hypothetical protein